MKYAGLEMKLSEMVEQRLEEGWNVTPGLSFYFRTQGMCCAIGAAIPDVEEAWSLPQLAAIRERLGGLSQEEALAISDGFEGFDLDRSRDMKELLKIGRRIRRRYCVE